MVRFMKAMVLAMRWMYDNKEPAIEFLAKEMRLKPEHARQGWEYYTEHKIWNPNAETNVEGVRTVIQIMRRPRLVQRRRAAARRRNISIIVTLRKR